MPSLRDVFVRLGVKTDPKGFDQADRGISKLKDGAITLGRVLATGAVAIGIKSMIGTASDIEETANKFGAVFGDAGSDVQTQLDDISKRTGATNMQLQDMASNIGALVKPALGSAAATGKLAAGVSEMALDIASFNNVTADEALIALRAGLIGSTEPLTRFGVDTRVASLELEALRQGIGKSVKDMTEGEKVSLRYASIQRQLGSQGATGDATRTAKGFANASRNLLEALKETAGVIGTFFLKSVGNLVNYTRELVDTFQLWLATNRELVQQRIEATLDRISNVIGSVSDAVSEVADMTSEWVEGLSPIGRQIVKLTVAAVGFAAALMLPGIPILALIALVALLIEDFQVWRKGGESVIGDIIGLFESLANTVRGYVDSLSASVDAMSRWVDEHRTGISVVTSLAAGFASVIGVALVAANKAAIAAWLKFQAFQIQYYATIYATSVATAVKSGAVWVATAAKSAAAWLAATLPLVLTIALLGIIVGTLIFLGREIYRLMTGQENFFSTMSEGIANLIQELGGVGPAIVEMLGEAARFWLEFFGTTEKQAAEFADNLTATLSTFWQNVIEFWSQLADDFFGGLISGVTGAISKVRDFFGGGDEEAEPEPETDVRQPRGPARQIRQFAERIVEAKQTEREDQDVVEPTQPVVRRPSSERLPGVRQTRLGAFSKVGDFEQGLVVRSNAPSQTTTQDSNMKSRVETRQRSIPTSEGSQSRTEGIRPVDAPSFLAPIVAPPPVSAMPMQSGPVDNSRQNISVTVNPSPGMDERRLAELTVREIRRARETEVRQAAQSFALGVSQ